MERIYDELEEAKVEAEKLREECQAKTVLSDSLRKAHIEQQAKIQQLKLEMDKLAHELNMKSHEICEIRQMYEELQASLHTKDSFLQQISSANDKLRAEYGENILKLEGENRDLVLALDEASGRIQDLEKKTCESSEEIAGLKRLLSVKPEKSFEVQKNALKALKERDEYIFKLEEENRIVQDQLKWKNEQFLHLEEAHGKLQTQFQASKVEWQKERSSLIEEISSLQANLDAQIRVSENLESWLRMSNQALAHEESRRKVLEIELSEYRSKFANVFMKCQEAKPEIEQLTMKGDEEIPELRILLRKKEILADDVKYKTATLEQENSDLLVSLKDIQESQINNNATSSSLKSLRNKLQGLEQLHNKCAVNLKEKETQWNSQIEKLRVDMNYCLSELDVKNKSIRELHKELEDCQCMLEVKNEETFALIMMLKSAFYDGYLKLYDTKQKLEMGNLQIEEENMLLNQQLQSKNSEVHRVYDELKQRCNEIAVLMEQIESSDSLKQEDNLMEEEFRRYKKMLDESNECQYRLNQQLLELENSQRENIQNALEVVNSELAKRTSEAEESRLEVQKLKSEAEILKLNLQENLHSHKQENASLLVSVKDKDANIGELQEQIGGLESVILAKSEEVEKLNHEKDNCIQLAEEKNIRIESLENEVSQLMNQLSEKEAQHVSLLKTLEQEKDWFSSLAKEKDQKIHELQKEFETLNQEFKSAMISFTEKEVLLNEGLKTAESNKILEIEEKNKMIANLEKEVNNLHKKVEFHAKSLVESKQVALQLEVSLQTKESETQELKSEVGKERRCFEGLLEGLKSDKQALIEDLKKASKDREDFVAQLEVIGGQLGVFCREDVELMCMLRKMSQFSEEESESARNKPFQVSTKAVQVTSDKRTPLKELNC